MSYSNGSMDMAVASALRSDGHLETPDGFTLRSRQAKSHGGLRPEAAHLLDDEILSAPSSGRSTPLPQDAPPSLKSIHHAKKQRRRRLFPTVDYEERVS